MAPARFDPSSVRMEFVVELATPFSLSASVCRCHRRYITLPMDSVVNKTLLFYPNYRASEGQPLLSDSQVLTDTSPLLKLFHVHKHFNPTCHDTTHSNSAMITVPVNPLRTKLYLSYFKIQSVPRSKHTPPRL